MKFRLSTLVLPLLLGLAGCAQPSDHIQTVKVVRLPYLNAAPLVIAEHEGYFREQNLEVQLVPFRRAGEGMAALARGQVDVIAGSVNLVLLNAVEKGAKVRIVADKGHFTASSCVVSALLVSPDALRDGTISSLASLKGKKVDFREKSILSYAYDSLLRRENLTLEDVNLVNLPRGGQLVALKNRAVAAVSAADPWLTLFQDSGSGVVWRSINEGIERLQYSMMAYGPTFLEESTEKGKRFMIAYLKGVRQYNQGKTERNLTIIAKETGVSSSVLSRSCWPDIDGNGQIIPDGLAEYQAWAVERGELARVLRMDELWDPRFIDHAVRALQDQSRSADHD
jgi:ABC-type nitrate/sulfonate/bicarbonate transport system substrate-binding protein